MDRRDFLCSVAAVGAVASGSLPTPALAKPSDARTLRFVPHADLSNFDPIWNVAYIARNAGLLVWDTLYGVDSALTPRRQMIETEQVSDNELSWTFRLRDGQRFHDNEVVRARDAVASINRWCARDPIGQMIKGIQNQLVAIDDRTFRWDLKKPFRKMLLALGKVATPCCFIMPERIALTDPFKPIGEYVGSGPARFIRDEWVPGARAVFDRFQDYRPRQEPSSWMAGGKSLSFDRIEWQVIPDPATAAAALQNGEVDWWERVLPDLVPTLRKRSRLSVIDADPFGYLGLLVMNHSYPPFSDVRARRALLKAINQEDYVSASAGSDNADWKAALGYFAPGSPLYTEEGSEIFKGPRDLDAARRLIRESGYGGEPIVCLAAQDIPNHKAWGDVTADLLKRLGMNVDLIAVDWGTVVARRAQKTPPSKGGWHIYHTGIFAVDTIDPTQKWVRAAGDQALNGWAKSTAIESEVAAWFDALNPDAEKAIAGRINRAPTEDVVYAPLGAYLTKYAFQNGLSGVSGGPAPFFWNITSGN
jgi:peptide/nickel transport system substrate-binding protein